MARGGGCLVGPVHVCEDICTPCAGSDSPILVIWAFKNAVARIYDIELKWCGVLGAELDTWPNKSLFYLVP